MHQAAVGHPHSSVFGDLSGVLVRAQWSGGHLYCSLRISSWPPRFRLRFSGIQGSRKYY